MGHTMPFAGASASHGVHRKLEGKDEGRVGHLSVQCNLNIPVFASKLGNRASFNYCPVHLQMADLSPCLSPQDADCHQRRLRALLVLVL